MGGRGEMGVEGFRTWEAVGRRRGSWRVPREVFPGLGRAFSSRPVAPVPATR